MNDMNEMGEQEKWQKRNERHEKKNYLKKIKSGQYRTADVSRFA